MGSLDGQLTVDLEKSVTVPEGWFRAGVSRSYNAGRQHGPRGYRLFTPPTGSSVVLVFLPTQEVIDMYLSMRLRVDIEPGDQWLFPAWIVDMYRDKARNDTDPIDDLTTGHPPQLTYTDHIVQVGYKLIDLGDIKIEELASMFQGVEVGGVIIHGWYARNLGMFSVFNHLYDVPLSFVGTFVRRSRCAVKELERPIDGKRLVIFEQRKDSRIDGVAR